MTDKKPEWEEQFKSIGFNNQAKIHGFSRYELLTYIELWVQQAKQQGFAEAFNLVEEEVVAKRIGLGFGADRDGKIEDALNDLQAIIHKMRGGI